MSEVSCDVKRTFRLIDSIVSREYIKDNWLSLLDSLAELFGVDGVFIGLWENGFIEFKYSSSLIKRIPSPQLKVDIGKRADFREKLISEGYIKIERYEEYPFALDEWKKVGLKSLLVVLIENMGGSVGSLHLVNFTRYIDFDEQQIEILKAIAHTIGSELYKEEMERELNREKETTSQYISLIRTVAESESENITEWITRLLKSLKQFTGASSVSLVFPSEDIYATLNGGVYSVELR